MLGRIISVRRVRFVAEEFLGVLFITLAIAKQPNIDDELWIALEIKRLEPIDGPFHRIFRPRFHPRRRLIADHDKRRLDDNREVVTGQFLFQPLDVPLEIGGGKS